MKQKDSKRETSEVRKSSRKRTILQNYTATFEIEEEKVEKQRVKKTLRSKVTSELSHSKRLECNVENSSSKVTKRQQGIVNNWYCNTCNYTYDSKEIYMFHQRQMHPEEIPKNHCNSCQKDFKSATFYENHIKRYHSEALKNYCSKCHTRFKYMHAYANHLKFYHANNQPYPANKVPNINDPGFYCKACSYSLRTKKDYHIHLKTFHYITDQEIVKSKIPFPDRKPDIYDSNNYCIACERTFNNQVSFRYHLQCLHDIQDKFHKRILHGHLEKPYIDPKSLFCHICSHTYRNPILYQKHMFKKHDTAAKTNSEKLIKRPSMEIDANDLKHYCCVCDRRYPNKLRYKKHLNEIHGMKTYNKKTAIV